MWKFLTVLAVLAVGTLATPTVRHRYELNAMRINVNRPFRGGRIVGGVDSKIEDFPYQISLRYNGRHTCGGSILNGNTVLSAAHCTL